MVVVQVHQTTITTNYKSTLLSKATILSFVCRLFLIIAPFVTAYRSGGFWLKHDSFHEQANIKFKGDFLLIATTTNIARPIICSSFPVYKRHFAAFDFCSTIKIREVDNNYDGLVEKLTLSFSLDLSDNAKVTSINLVVPVDFKLRTVCPLEMNSAIIYQQYLNLPISDLSIMSDLEFYQTEAIFCKSHFVHNFYNQSIIDENLFEIEDIISNYWQRNVSTHLSNIYTTIQTKNKTKFDLNLTVRYPKSKIYFKPRFWQTIKWAWIQYFAFYIIIAWIITKIKSYIFDNRLVLFYEDSPLKQKFQ